MRLLSFFLSLFFFFFDRLFGNSGACSACGQSIPASELVMRAQGNVYHLKVNSVCCINLKFILIFVAQGDTAWTYSNNRNYFSILAMEVK